MQPLAADLHVEDMRRLADYYAELVPPQTPPRVRDAALIESGRKLVVEGAPEIGVPACVTCHTSTNPSAPRLAGQHEAYMAGQLRFRKTGQVSATGNAALMASIPQRLRDEQNRPASPYPASLPPGPLETSSP